VQLHLSCALSMGAIMQLHLSCALLLGTKMQRFGVFVITCYLYSAVVMGAGVQAFPTGQQGGLGVAYPPGLNPLDSRLAQSPHGGRTPGRGNFRTPFSYQPQSRLSQSHSGSMTQRSSDSHVPIQLAVSAEMSSGESATAGVMTSLEALSVADKLGGRRLSPIMTHAVLSPSDVILASAARSRAAELTAVTLAQMTEPFPPDSAPVLGDRQSELAVTPAVVPTNASELGNKPTATSQPETAFATAESVESAILLWMQYSSICCPANSVQDGNK